MAESLRSLVAESLALLRWSVPPAFDRLGQRLAGLPLSIEVGAEHFGVESVAGQVRVATPPTQPLVALRTDAPTIGALLDGKLDLRTALYEDRLYLRGTIHDLRRLLGALDVYLQGAVRAEGFEALKLRFRGEV